MGFTPRMRILSLDFSETEYEGLEVDMRMPSLRDYLNCLPGSDSDNEEVVAIIDRHLERWNLEIPEGTPVIPDVNGISSQDFDMISTILVRWRRAISGNDRDLGKDSTNGKRAMEESLPMEV
jgi:hypothetical protein